LSVFRQKSSKKVQFFAHFFSPRSMAKETWLCAKFTR